MATQKQVIKAAQAWRAGDYRCRTRKEFPVGAERQRRIAERKQKCQRLKEVTEELDGYHVNHLKQLADAARFALDVDGDEPAWTQLREATERAESYMNLREERERLREECSRTANLLTHGRCELIDVKSWCVELIAVGDTWADVLAALERKCEGADTRSFTRITV